MKTLESQLLDFVNTKITTLTTKQLNADDEPNYNDELYGATDNFLETLEIIANGLIIIKNQPKSITRYDFMEFFRGVDENGDDLLNQLDTDERKEIFSQIMLGSDDFTKDLLDSVLSDYCVDNLEVIEK